jgi:hypothetical protein
MIIFKKEFEILEEGVNYIVARHNSITFCVSYFSNSKYILQVELEYEEQLIIRITFKTKEYTSIEEAIISEIEYTFRNARLNYLTKEFEEFFGISSIFI